MTFHPTPWSENLEHGLSWMDDQHRSLIELNERLYRDFEAGNSEARLAQAFRALKEYVRVHFAAEERYMAEYAYGQAAEHTREHETFVLGLERFIEETAELDDIGDELSIPSLCMEVEQWLVEHILVTDRELARFVHERERERAAAG